MKISHRLKQYLPVFFTILPPLIGMAFIIIATRWGPGVGGDSTIYMTTARSLLEGKGPSWPDPDGSLRILPYSPPGYTLFLSLLALTGIDLVDGARLTNVIMFGLLIFISGQIIQKATGRFWLGVLTAALTSVSPVMLGVQVWVMSESLFFLLAFGGTAFLVRAISGKNAGLWWAGLLFGAATLVRYPGVTFAAAGGLVYLWANRQPLLRRWLNAIGYGLVCLVPTFIWFIYDYVMTTTIGNRTPYPAEVLGQRLLSMIAPLLDIYLFWWVPDSIIMRLSLPIQAAAFILPVLLTALLTIWLIRRHKMPFDQWRDSLTARLAIVLLIMIPAFLALHAWTFVVTYPPITLSNRVFAPLHLACLWLLALLAHGLLNQIENSSRRSWLPLVVYVAVFGLLASYGLRGALIVRDNANKGIGYTAPRWRNSEVMETLRRTSASHPIITNEMTAVMFYTRRSAYTLQELYADQPLQIFTTFGQGDDPSEAAFRSGGILVLFDTIHEHFANMYGSQGEARLEKFIQGLTLVYHGADGNIYMLPDKTPKCGGLCN